MTDTVTAMEDEPALIHDVLIHFEFVGGLSQFVALTLKILIKAFTVLRWINH